MKILSILEKYTGDNTYLQKYLSSGTVDIDPYVMWNSDDFDPNIVEWLDDKYPDLLKKLIQGYKVNDASELEPEAWYELPDKVIQEYTDMMGEEFLEYMNRYDPSEAPSTAFYDNAVLIKRQTWLVHFSDKAWHIAADGFKYGIDQMDKLGLTTWYNNESFNKKHGGYNFAFEAGGRYATYAARDGKYGEEAVMFTNSGVKAYHNGDQEEQIIFWGKDVDPRDIIYIAKVDGEWCVSPHPLKSRKKNFDRDCVFSNDEFKNVTDWIEAHWRQYSKVITGW